MEGWTGDPAKVGMGPQHAGDSAFVARMRWHQSWYRCEILKAAWGTGPTARSETEMGSMLCREAGAAGKNFLTPEIGEVARERLEEESGVVEPYRLGHNMLSSQPMCFNLFGPLVRDLELARRVLGMLVPDEVERVVRVRMEHSPTPRAEYLSDHTAFDAFFEYRRRSGGLGFVGIETKLTEKFSQQLYDGAAYRFWTEREDSPWPREHWGRLREIGHNQLWRDHLLCEAMLRHGRSPYRGGQFLLVRHEHDVECAKALGTYRTLLKAEYGNFRSCTIGELVALLGRAAGGTRHEDWARRLAERYVDLRRSEDSWRARNAAKMD